MKLRGGYFLKVAGRPSREVREAPVPEQLFFELRQDGVTFVPAVSAGDQVKFGAPLAWATSAGGRIALPAPAGGKVSLEPAKEDLPERIVLTVTKAAVRAVDTPHSPDRTTSETMRTALARGGIWPRIWSSKTGGMPCLDGSEEPHRILVNFVAAEPFRTRGKVILQEDWKHVAAGLRFLPRLLSEYGIIHLVLTELTDPVVQAIREEMAGHAWIRIETAPIRYPVEHPQVLCRALRQSVPGMKPGEIVWVLDVQTVQTVGACMADGIPLYERIVAVGGPGVRTPCHFRVRVGTSLRHFLETADFAPSSCVLKGGLLSGRPAAPTAAVESGDDAFFILPRPVEREFLGFVNPGFDRVSILPCFASRLTGAADRHITTSIRGERRPCIACGLCEKVCPVGLLPQVLHRYLYRDAIDEAERTGLPLCIGCGLCTYVCPSKIELSHQFAEARERIRREHEEMAAVQAAAGRREDSKLREKEHSGEWKQ